MALTSAYVLPTNRVSEIFNKIRDGQAPERFTHQLLKDWGFTSTNDRAFVPLLKSLGFLTGDGVPTNRYNDYRDHSRSRQVMGQALKEAYGDLFLIKASPSNADRNAIEGKFKSFHNVSDHVAGVMTKTFMALLALADLSSKHATPATPEESTPKVDVIAEPNKTVKQIGATPSLHYNIQIHLPATKDIEVYNAIFKALKGHLLND